MLSQSPSVPPPIKKQRSTKTPIKHPKQNPSPPFPMENSTLSTRRAALQAMQQRLVSSANSSTTTPTQQVRSVGSNASTMAAMARSQLDSSGTPIIRSHIKDALPRSASVGSRQKQYGSVSTNRPMHSIMVENRQNSGRNSESDDDSLLVTPPDYHNRMHASSTFTSSSKKNGRNFKSSPPPPPTPKELQKYYSTSTSNITTTTSNTVTTPLSSFSSARNHTTATASSNPPNNTNTLRLIQKLVEVTEEKTAALKKATSLEQTLYEYKQQQQQTRTITTDKKVHQPNPREDATKFMMQGAGIMKLLVLQNQMEKKLVSTVFSTWKKHTFSSEGGNANAPVEAPVMAVRPSTSSSRSSVKAKSATPPLSTKYFIEALNTVSLEYTSDFASYTIRSPYTHNHSQHSTSKGILPHEQYQNNATVLNPITLELYIQIYADQSYLTLHSNDTLHNNNSLHPTTSNLKQPLGKILYITSKGIEEEYDLQFIFNEAMIVRENYCTNLVTAAYALQLSDHTNATTHSKDYTYDNDDSSTIATKDTFHNHIVTQHASVGDVCDKGIQTEDIPTPTITPPETTTATMEPTSYFGTPSSAMDELASNFIFTTFRGFTLFLKIIFLFLPKFLLRSTFYLTVGTIASGVLWFLLANDHGAWNRMVMDGYYIPVDGEGEHLDAFWNIARNSN